MNRPPPQINAVEGHARAAGPGGYLEPGGCTAFRSHFDSNVLTHPARGAGGGLRPRQPPLLLPAPRRRRVRPAHYPPRALHGCLPPAALLRFCAFHLAEPVLRTALIRTGCRRYYGAADDLAAGRPPKRRWPFTQIMEVSDTDPSPAQTGGSAGNASPTSPTAADFAAPPALVAELDGAFGKASTARTPKPRKPKPEAPGEPSQ